MITANVQHPISGKRRRMDFYVAAAHDSAILGIEVCIEMELIYVNHENICVIHKEPHTEMQSSVPLPPPGDRRRSRRAPPPSTETSGAPASPMRHCP